MGQFKEYQELKNRYIATKSEVGYLELESEARQAIIEKFISMFEKMIEELVGITESREYDLHWITDAAKKELDEMKEYGKKSITDLVNQ